MLWTWTPDVVEMVSLEKCHFLQMLHKRATQKFKSWPHYRQKHQMSSKCLTLDVQNHIMFDTKTSRLSMSHGCPRDVAFLRVCFEHAFSVFCHNIRLWILTLRLVLNKFIHFTANEHQWFAVKFKQHPKIGRKDVLFWKDQNDDLIYL